MSDKNRFVITRHTTLERITHYLNIFSLTGLVVTGFVVYFGLPYMEYSNAYAIHIICAAVFASVNWIVMPYNAFINRTLFSYMFWPKDYKRLWMVLKSFFTGSEYPKYTVYDLRRRRFINRLHPVSKLLIYSHYLALLIVTITGVVLYSTSVFLLGINISGLIIKLLDFLGPSLDLSGIALARLLHIAAGYWFIIEVVLHIGIVQLDPKKFQHIKSIFIDGKEDLMKDETAEILHAIDE